MAPLRTIFALFTLLISLVGASDVSILHKQLLQNYHPSVIPVASHQDSITVKLNINLHKIDLSSNTDTMTTQMWLLLEWTDQNLTWQPEKHNGIKKINLPATSVWRPDIMIYNNADDAMELTETNVVLANTGAIVWVPPITVRTLCQVSLLYWPFDRQMCNLKLGSWTYSNKQVKLVISKTEVGELGGLSREWNVVSASLVKNSKVYPCCPEAYDDITLKLELQRDDNLANLVAFVPVLMVVVMTLAMFWLPANSTARFTIGVVNLLILTVLIVFFFQALPGTGQLPDVVVFHGITFSLVVLAILITIAVSSLYRTNTPATETWVGCFSGIAGKLLCLGSGSAVVLDEEGVPKEEIPRTEPEKWAIIATGTDRLVFVVYLVAFIAFIAVYM